MLVRERLKIAGVKVKVTAVGTKLANHRRITCRQATVRVAGHWPTSSSITYYKLEVLLLPALSSPATVVSPADRPLYEWPATGRPPAPPSYHLQTGHCTSGRPQAFLQQYHIISVRSIITTGTKLASHRRITCRQADIHHSPATIVSPADRPLYEWPATGRPPAVSHNITTVVSPADRPLYEWPATGRHPAVSHNITTVVSPADRPLYEWPATGRPPAPPSYHLQTGHCMSGRPQAFLQQYHIICQKYYYYRHSERYKLASATHVTRLLLNVELATNVDYSVLQPKDNLEDPKL
ncbi:hypothetical protein J6590_104288, partial [Homalodisca vitripennis]